LLKFTLLRARAHKRLNAGKRSVLRRLTKLTQSVSRILRRLDSLLLLLVILSDCLLIALLLETSERLRVSEPLLPSNFCAT
jgi:hypothetical protein